jgi:hypothetical protein
MDPIKHPQHTKWWNAPKNWDETRDGPCGALSVRTISNLPYHPTYESAWRPTHYESVSLALQLSTIRLGIIGQMQHPPVYLGTMPSEISKEELWVRLMQVATQLTEVAESRGLILTIERKASVNRHGVQRETVVDVREKIER